MASIRRKNDKWQAVIRRAGEATLTRSFRSKTDARKWAIAAEQRLDRGLCGQINKAALNDSLGVYLGRYETHPRQLARDAFYHWSSNEIGALRLSS